MTFQAWRSITTDQFILCIVFCEEIKWTDAPVLIYDRTHIIFDSRAIYAISRAISSLFTISLISLLWRRILASFRPIH